MKLTSDNETLAENKVLILYILYKVNKPITNEEFLKLVLSVTDMNYFYFQQFVLDLIDTKYIITYKKEEGDVYEITNEGKEALHLTSDMIPGIMKLKVDKNFEEEFDSIENEVSIKAEYIPRSEKDYTVKCKIIENATTMFEIKTFAGSGEKAKEIVENWKNNAIEIYPKILDLLTPKK